MGDAPWCKIRPCLYYYDRLAVPNVRAYAELTTGEAMTDLILDLL
jgi:hypothetical protein